MLNPFDVPAHQPFGVQLSKAVIIGWGVLAWLPLVVLIAAYLALA